MRNWLQICYYIEDQMYSDQILYMVNHSDQSTGMLIVQKSSSRYEHTITKLWLKFECFTTKTVGGDRFQSKEIFSICKTILAKMAKSNTATHVGQSSYKAQAGMRVP